MKVSPFVLVAIVASLQAVECQKIPRINEYNLIEDAVTTQWNNFKDIFHKVYHNDYLEQVRRAIFKQNTDVITRHNAEAQRGKHSFTMKTNKYSDMDIRTINRVMNGFRAQPKNPVALSRPPPVAYQALPEAVDWNARGLVSPIKDQGSCGSCYTFSATGAIESAVAIAQGRRTNLSEQQLVDCTYWGYNNQGCNGGFMDNCYEYLVDNGGLEGGATYPYEGKDRFGLFCRYRRKNSKAKVTSYVDIPQGDEESLQVAVATVGPVSVAIDAGLVSFQNYNQGVYYDAKCSKNVNHAVLVTGYGTADDGKKFWMVKNSWGESWGDKGYIKMTRGSNHCGIAEYASYPVV